MMDIVYSIDINTYNVRSSVQLVLKDFRFSEKEDERNNGLKG